MADQPDVSQTPITLENDMTGLHRMMRPADSTPPSMPRAPEPPRPAFPLPAVLGKPPPPLPAARAVPPPPLPQSALRFGQSSSGPSADEAVDPTLDEGLGALTPWTSRLRCVTVGDWSAATRLHAEGPMRHTRGPNFAFWDEPSLRVTMALLPAASLNPADEHTPLLSRLRMLHERVLPDSASHPIAADWYELNAQPAVLDRFAGGPRAPVSGFCLSTELADDLGLLAYGCAPPSRNEALTHVAMPLATTGRFVDDRLTWCTPVRWARSSEEMMLTTDTRRATVKLEHLAQGWGLDEWTRLLFDRAPFLRDRQTLAHRPVVVPGVDTAMLHCFHWQPSARDRMLTTVVAGIAGDAGFSFVLEVPYDAADHALLSEPDAVLSMVSVDAAS